jgi:septum site-determining protein MinD
MVITNPEISAVRDADRIIGLIEAEEKGPAQLVINRIEARYGAPGGYALHQ